MHTVPFSLRAHCAGSSAVPALRSARVVFHSLELDINRHMWQLC
jgi:hypothetical protein